MWPFVFLKIITLEGEVGAKMIDSAFTTLKALAEERVNIPGNAANRSMNQAALLMIDAKSAAASTMLEIFDQKSIALLGCLYLQASSNALIDTPLLRISNRCKIGW